MCGREWPVGVCLSYAIADLLVCRLYVYIGLKLVARKWVSVKNLDGCESNAVKRSTLMPLVAVMIRAECR